MQNLKTVACSAKGHVRYVHRICIDIWTFDEFGSKQYKTKKFIVAGFVFSTVCNQKSVAELDLYKCCNSAFMKIEELRKDNNGKKLV